MEGLAVAADLKIGYWPHSGNDVKLMTGRSALLVGHQPGRLYGSMVRKAGTALDGVALPPAFSATFSSCHLETGSVRLHAVVGGKGPPVLLVHGWPQTWYAWRFVMPALAMSSTVVAVDVRGAGRSGKPLRGYDAGILATDLVRLMQRLGYPRFTVVGHDVGMWIAYATAADHPERVEQIAVVEGVLPGIPLTSPLICHEAVLDDRTDQLPIPAVRSYAEAPAWDAGTLRASFQYGHYLDRTIAQNKQRLKQPLSVPVLAIGGEACLGERVAAAMRYAATDVTEVVIPDCGHYPAEEKPDDLIAALLRSLR